MTNRKNKYVGVVRKLKKAFFVASYFMQAIRNKRVCLFVVIKGCIVVPRLCLLPVIIKYLFLSIKYISILYICNMQ